jgi:hypothetical protein
LLQQHSWLGVFLFPKARLLTSLAFIPAPVVHKRQEKRRVRLLLAYSGTDDSALNPLASQSKLIVSVR